LALGIVLSAVGGSDAQVLTFTDPTEFAVSLVSKNTIGSRQRHEPNVGCAMTIGVRACRDDV
jgi:hypothetical protein